ncbi:MAG TPA: DICT sensory domain-containing protein [Gaiellaceae bacterium]|nr:DICT sensory domain-containing protein [Gaiellaceae bacterium]
MFAALAETGQAVSRRGMATVSHALEDEVAARAEAGVLVGLFQERRYYEASAERWEKLARQAAACVVLADFAEPSAADERPARVPLRARSQLAQEWGIVHVAEGSSVLLVGGRGSTASRANGASRRSGAWIHTVPGTRSRS